MRLSEGRVLPKFVSHRYSSIMLLLLAREIFLDISAGMCGLGQDNHIFGLNKVIALFLCD
jgi:hypothetical protein